MNGMDLASALTAPVQGRGAQQGARSRAEAGDSDAESFDAVFNGVQGAADAAPQPTDGDGTRSAADSAAPGTEPGPAALPNPSVASATDAAVLAGFAGAVAGVTADQLPPMTAALGLPALAGQAPSADPAAGAVATTPGPDPRLAVPGAILAAAALPVAPATLEPAAASIPGPQAVNTVPATGVAAGAPASAAPAGTPAGTGLSGASSTAAAIAVQTRAAEQLLGAEGTSGGGSAAAVVAAPAPAGRAAAVLENPTPAPNMASVVAAPSTALATESAPPSAALLTSAAAGGAAAVPAAALAEGSSAGAAGAETTPAAAPVHVPASDGLAAAGSAALTVPASQPTSSTAAALQPPAPAAHQPGATLQPQLARPLFTLAGAPHGQHIMTLQVTPEDLGPMTVRAHIDAAGVRIELFAPGDAGREAIRIVLPELRKELADAGFGASLDLSEHNGPGNTAGDGTGPDQTSQNGRDGAGRDPGSGPGNRYGAGDQRPGHRWDALADDAALRNARILNGPQTTLDILV